MLKRWQKGPKRHVAAQVSTILKTAISRVVVATIVEGLVEM